MVTVYHAGGEADPHTFGDPDPQDGLAFITETRTIDIPAGPATIEFRGVASTIIPQTAAVDGLPVHFIERNFDYDLLSPGSLFQKSIGETVTVVRTDKKSGKTTERNAVLRSGPDGAVLDFGGSFEALDCSGLPEKLVFSRVPEGLRDTPTLSIRTDARQAGHYTVKLSYMATSVNWAANYVARLHPDGNSLDLTGWVTLINASETSFKNVPLDIVAGRVERVADEDRPVEPARLYRQNACWPTNINWAKIAEIKVKMMQMAPPPPPPPPVPASADEMLETVSVTGFRASQDLGDYKLYSLNGTTDVLGRQTKLVQFLDQKDVSFERFYFFELATDQEWNAASVGLRLKNTKENHLGLALPAGVFTATAVSDEHAAVVLGRENFRDYSVGSPIELEMGKALDVYVQERFVGRESVRYGRDGMVRITADYVVENHKTGPIDFELRKIIDDVVKVVSESDAHSVTGNGMVWRLHLAAGESKTVRLTLQAKP